MVMRHHATTVHNPFRERKRKSPRSRTGTTIVIIMGGCILVVGALLSSVTFVGQFVAVQQQNGSRSTLYEYPTTTTTTTSADTTTTTTTTDSVLYLRTTAADRWGLSLIHI